MPYIFNRAYGALVGQCCGDALGCRYKFRSADDVREQISADRDDSYFLPIRGSAVFDFPPGQVNDGTEYCMLIARSLSRQGCVDLSDIGESILRWKQSDPIATHNPVFEAAELETENEDPQISSGGQLEKKIILSALLKNKSCLSNMCLSIATPLAISTATRLNDSMTSSLSLKLTRLTQPHPAAQDAVRVLAAAIRSLILCPDPQIAYEVALKNAKTSIVLEHLEDARHRPHPFPEVEQENGSCSFENEIPIDYLGITLQIAFYHLLYSESFYDGVISSISLGGDTTTNAAITGALLGARFGAQSIPEQWKNTVENAKLERHKVFPDVYLSDAQSLINRLLYKLSF
jgi:ADP-ribosyl-[dinitrogen reductase] hydrolase